MTTSSTATAPTAVIISIGEELLEGRIRDTNAGTFAAALLERGFHVTALYTVGDGPGELHDLLAQLRDTVDVILSTGGLGPTADDRVREEVSAALDVNLVAIPVPGATKALREMYARFHSDEPPTFFLEQALMPDGAKPLTNAKGTAWGFQCILGRRTRLYVMPGPPQECAATFFDGGAADDLEQHFCFDATQLAHTVLHTTGAPESTIERPIRAYLQAGKNPRVGITASVNGVSLSLLARQDSDGRSAKEVLASCVAELKAELSPYYWGHDEQTLAGVVVNDLMSAGQTVACAESCTGGLLAADLTDVPGASSALTHGWVVYANQAKVKQLGVPTELIAAHGAVSEEVALSMAKGALTQSGSDWALAITGTAGPGGGSEEKPVGTVYVALVGPDTEVVRRFLKNARGGRKIVRIQTVCSALDMLRRALAGIPQS